MSFSTLPNEVICQIIRSTSDPSTQQLDFTTLRQLSLCSKHFHLLTTPILYATWTQRDETSLPQLFATLSNHPHLGQFVRHLELEDQRGQIYWNKNAATFPSYRDGVSGADAAGKLFEEHMTRLCAEIDCNNEEERAKLLKDLKKQSWSALAMAAILSLPNLHRFSLKVKGVPTIMRAAGRTTVWAGRYKWIQLAFQRATLLQSTPRSQDAAVGSTLESVDLKFPAEFWRSESIIFSTIHQLLSLPSIRQVSLANLSDTMEWDIDTPTFFKNVRHLHLKEVKQCRDTLNRLLGCFPCLETLRVESGYGWGGLFFSIQHLQHSLKELTVTFTHTNMEYERGVYGGFLQLEKMNVAASHLGGWTDDEMFDRPDMISFTKVIPRTVKELVLTFCQGRVLEKLTELFADSDWLRESKLQNLKLICLESSEPWIEKHREKLEGQCRDAGINVEIIWDT